jgi:hypothetical protein
VILVKVAKPLTSVLKSRGSKTDCADEVLFSGFTDFLQGWQLEKCGGSLLPDPCLSLFNIIPYLLLHNLLN